MPADFTSTITPYICVTPAADALDWYREVFGARETVRYTGDDGRIGHAELSIDGAPLMLSDEYPGHGVVAPSGEGGVPCSLSLSVADVDAVYRRAVDGGAKGQRPPADEVFGERVATIVDPFGHRWMLLTKIAEPSLDEINAAATGFTATGPEPDR
jgi:PhnB protein